MLEPFWNAFSSLAEIRINSWFPGPSPETPLETILFPFQVILPLQLFSTRSRAVSWHNGFPCAFPGVYHAVHTLVPHRLAWYMLGGFPPYVYRALDGVLHGV